MRCSACNRENPGDASFCEQCGAKLELTCSACKASVSAGARFCKKCGTPIAGAKSAASAVSSPEPQIIIAVDRAASHTIEGERKTVTALFADIKGSTELIEDLDPEEARAIIDPALNLMIEAVRRYDGYVVQSTGDGIFALFGAPVAHEDHPQRALYAALRMQEELKRYSAKVVAEGGSPIQGRVGINTGEVVVRSIQTGEGQVEYTPIGHTSNLASRMQTVAPVGSIAISENTRRLCEGYFILKALGPTRVKGVSGPVNVYEVTGLGPLRTRLQRAAGRGLTKFVGREPELELLRNLLEKTIAGHGQVVLVSAEAGVGKSRLFHEFKAMIPSKCKSLEAYTVSHGKAAAWLPVVELMRNYFRIEDADDPEIRREKVHAALSALDPALANAQPFLFGLLGLADGPDPLALMDPLIKRQRILDTIKCIVLSESLKQPLVLVIEDLHWIDDETQTLLDLLAKSIENAPVLLLLNCRPEYLDPWHDKPNYSKAQLKALDREPATRMLTELLGDGVELNPLRRMIIERTGGTPFFIEEIVQALFDDGTLIRNGNVKVTRSISQLRLPPTVQGILAARIDRLTQAQKELLQILAVIGQRIPVDLVSLIVARAGQELSELLMSLQIKGFIHQQLGARGSEFIFKHALTTEVAYSSLLIERRKKLHARVGAAIEQLHANAIEQHLGELAHHYRHSDATSKAVEYLWRSGERSGARLPNQEAVDDLQAALEILPRLTDPSERSQRELSIQLAIAGIWRALHGWNAPKVESAYRRALALAQDMIDSSAKVQAVVGLAYTYCVAGKERMAIQLSAELEEMARNTNDAGLLLRALDCMGQSYWVAGDYTQGLKCMERLIATYRPGISSWRPEYDYSAILAHRSQVLIQSGLPVRAGKALAEALDFADRHDDRMARIIAMEAAADVQFQLRNVEGVFDYCRQLKKLLEEIPNPLYSATCAALEGWARARMGQHDEGLQIAARASAAAQLLGGWFAYYSALMFAETCVIAKSREAGLSAIALCESSVENTDIRLRLCDLLRTKADLLSIDGAPDSIEPEFCFREAVGIARSQGAKWLELRATTSLARLLRNTNRRDEAHTLLADIYNWFTEGFDTADLKEAKALLDELSA